MVEIVILQSKVLAADGRYVVGLGWVSDREEVGELNALAC